MPLTQVRSSRPGVPAPDAAAGPKNVQPNVVLAVCCLSMLLVGMDGTIVNVALPAIQKSFQANLSGLQWIVDAYTLVVASLLMFAGSVSDRVGRRRIFQIGLALFILGSGLCSLAHTVAELIAYRVLQGLGASMLNPVALSIVANVFPDPKDRARAIGVWGAVAGLSLALGPIIGGALTQTVGWRSIFWINIPIGLLALVLAATLVPESKAARARALDPLGQTLVIVGLGTLIYGLIEGARLGWNSPQIEALFGTASLCLIGFVLVEPRRKEPLLDLRFFRSVIFSSAAVLALCSFSSFAGLLFLNALYLQQARGFSALQTGMCTLPLAILMSVTSPLSGKLVGIYGTRPSLLVAGGGFILGSLILTRLDPQTPVPLLLLAYSLFGLGLGMVNPAISNSAVAGMPLSQAGVAAGIASTSRQVGTALGVAVAGSVVSAHRATGVGFTEATHPIWWALVGSGVVVLTLGWIPATPWVAAQEAKSRAQFAT